MYTTSGRKLGVANVLEGSVRKEGDRVVVNVQLIDTRNNRQIWANRYDRTLVDSLGLQGELASEIADTLRATLSDDEKALASSETDAKRRCVRFLSAREPDLQQSRYAAGGLQDRRAALHAGDRTRSEFRTRSRAARIRLC